MGGFKKLVARYAVPDIAPDIRDEFVIHAASDVQKNARWLFFFLFLTTPLAAFAGSDAVPWIVRWGMPVVMGVYCLLGFAMLSRPLDFTNSPKLARHFVVDSSISSCFGALICSTWCVLSWLYAPVDDRLQFPIILVMGALATAYCLANVRIGAVANLVIDLAPISLLLLTSGEMLNFAAGSSLLLAGLFQWRMINAHHRHVISLLKLQKENRQLALTDPLTGLLNRRALQDFADALAMDRARARILLIDIDRFKAINDRHGHDTGDEVLVEIARIIQSFDGNSISAARLGGEEFALLGSDDALPSSIALKVLAAIREAPMPHGEPVTVSIGIAEGIMHSPEDWQRLYSKADAALYEAKNSGRNRFFDASAVNVGSVDENGRAEPAPKIAAA
ncbi:GGDEF domain-containing protein [Erythrobacter sp. GH1-10]|uniref:GGDEF domain-containing protein n=1 Tax=Erythrobacter sp. GH1-10 TaxID=3349334 RepID=UPI0038783E24